MLLALRYSRCVPFAVVQGVCKYVGDKVGNRPIAALCDGLLSGNEIAESYICFVPLPTVKE
jgi:hypothetical protein